jgi:hypothetical protein
MVLKDIGKLLDIGAYVQIKNVSGEMLYLGVIGNCPHGLVECRVIHLNQLTLVSAESPSISDMIVVLQIVIKE